VPYAILIALVLLVATALGAVRQRAKQDNSGSTIPGTGIELSDLGSISWEEVEVLLDRLDTREPPEPVFGAMCYEMVAAPSVAEYVCPVCGEKTQYTEYDTWFVEFELPGCRRIFDEIAGIADMDIELDETRMCSYCTDADSAEAALYLKVTLGDGTVVSNRVTEFDLRLLESFFKGRLFYYTSNDGQEPLQPYADRIRELLGQPVPE
jgi:hypothetical protein